jgi:predicted DNA-binding protein
MPVSYTPVMKRTCIFLTEQQLQKLEKASKKTGLKVAELVRRFIDAGLEKA